MQDVEAVQNEIVGQAHVENYALKLFLYADNEDRAARFGKYVDSIATNDWLYFFRCCVLKQITNEVMKSFGRLMGSDIHYVSPQPGTTSRNCTTADMRLLHYRYVVCPFTH